MDTAWHMEMIISVDRMALAVAMTVACKQDQVNAHIGCGWCTQADEEDQLTGEGAIHLMSSSPGKRLETDEGQTSQLDYAC